MSFSEDLLNSMTVSCKVFKSNGVDTHSSSKKLIVKQDKIINLVRNTNFLLELSMYLSNLANSSVEKI